jgi:hypothetical protein
LFAQATCTPVAETQAIAVRGAYRVDAGADTPVGPPAVHVVGSFPSIPATASNVGAVDLVQGGSCVFSVAVNNAVGGSPYTADCSAALVVMVVRQ